jgi:hypothetical protein
MADATLHILQGVAFGIVVGLVCAELDKWSLRCRLDKVLDRLERSVL